MPQEGKRIWIESLLSNTDYKEQAKKYPKMYTNGAVPPEIFDCDFYWRRGMGSLLKQEEINNINYNIDYLLKNNVL